MNQPKEVGFFTGLMVALWITACMWGIYHIGHANGEEAASCPAPGYYFDKAQPAFVKR
jgi:hypothetical protein